MLATAGDTAYPILRFADTWPATFVRVQVNQLQRTSLSMSLLHCSQDAHSPVLHLFISRRTRLLCRCLQLPLCKVSIWSEWIFVSIVKPRAHVCLQVQQNKTDEQFIKPNEHFLFQSQALSGCKPFFFFFFSFTNSRMMNVAEKITHANSCSSILLDHTQVPVQSVSCMNASHLCRMISGCLKMQWPHLDPGYINALVVTMLQAGSVGVGQL